MQLSEIIRQKICEEGPVSFCDFMEMALYYPELGYYNSQKDKIGNAGDYYTTPVFTPLGEMLAKQLEEMWHLLGKETFTIVEYGAGTGCLCHSILSQLKHNEELYSKLHYCIIEKSPAMRDREKMLLSDIVSWYDPLDAIPLPLSCILSNEVVDNFPVHLVEMQKELMEVYLDYENGLIEMLQPASNELKDYFDDLGVHLPKGFRTEVNLEAIKWLQDISSALHKGFMLTIDYGYSSSELYRETRKSGTLLCYYKHRINDDFYHHIGEQDITSHINFSALTRWGMKYGLGTCGYTNQAHFLLSLGFAEHLREKEKQLEKNYSESVKDQLLLHRLLIDMGSKFKVLIQQKGMQAPTLSGLKFCRQLV